MSPDERKKKQRQLTEQYEQDKRALQQTQKKMEEDVDRFKKETEKLMDKVLYLTKNDSWDKRVFYRQMEESQATIQSEARRFTQKVEEKQNELKRTYLRTVEKIEKEEE
ncbi:hypothetical protein [Enterococcus termitis]|uniref:Uncharacterized protein n=1 Tax=Enterococcus termitis TaxID=332950 RepID=A0A1E5GAM1_9ENTE|nr:hypothetical protein [Enterococcus termitis]OEG09766.1 hypothetical protein BCR25_09660 [Enterococcus termitis]OJG96894.1 hypothetical protein RV18_GL001732 [Enterococcus termitis]